MSLGSVKQRVRYDSTWVGTWTHTYVHAYVRTRMHSRQAEQSLDVFCLDAGSPPAFQARATESFGIGKLVLFPVAAHLVALDVGKEIKRPSALHPTLQAVCQMQVQIGGEDRLSVDTA